ncbi:MAG: hypothetical protein PHS63_01280 [Desulfoplanes sp.]|jgi:hypothetical protein|nr:hypothetical protein [Desulfoplanes sp.]
MTSQTTQKQPPLPPDVQAAYNALKRAALKARLIAKQTGTYLVYVENGKIIKEIPSDSVPPNEILGQNGDTL